MRLHAKSRERRQSVPAVQPCRLSPMQEKGNARHRARSATSTVVFLERGMSPRPAAPKGARTAVRSTEVAL